MSYCEPYLNRRVKLLPVVSESSKAVGTVLHIGCVTSLISGD